jgi:hypothetical protein
MQNNTYPTRQILLNALTSADFGLYNHVDPDGAGTTVHLLIKKYGIDIPFIDTTHSLVTVSKTTSGILESVLLSTNAPAPCSDCYYDFWIDIVKRVKDPGVLNDDYYKKGRPYGGSITAIQAPVNGQLTDTDKLYMEDTIIQAIKDDQATNITTREPSVAHAKRLYMVTVAIGASNGQKLTYLLADGTTATIDLDSYATSILMACAINAAWSTYFVCACKSTTELILWSVDPELSYTLSDGNGTVPVTTLKRYIWLYSKDVKSQFNVRFSPGVFTKTVFNMIKILNTGTQSGNSVFYINGTSSGNIANHDTSTTYAASINTAITTSGYATAETTGSDKPVYLYTGTYELRVSSYGYAGVTTSYQYSGQGVFPNLTSDDVFRVFMNKRHLGEASIYGYIPQPIDGGLYNKITITNITGHNSAIHGASHLDDYVYKVEIYLLQGYGATHLWDADAWMNESATDGTYTVDSDINDLITHWGVTVTAIV